jgi:hypothetical protein
MRPATGRVVDIPHGYDPHQPFYLGRLAKWNITQFLGTVLQSADRKVVHDDAISIVLDLVQLFGFDRGARDIDSALVGAQMERKGASIENALKRGRENVLACVLLHMILSSLPVDASLDGISLQWGIKDVDDLILDFQHVQHRHQIEVTGVVGLPT